ncbi:MAG: hypothetical protein II811_09160 [Spirochaetaceae bacterium]|nr:hypothetical protein [Spirochaetaceae bacterium]
MSAAEMKHLENELALLSYAERLAIVEYLVQSLQQAYDEEKEAAALGFSGGAQEKRNVDEAIAQEKRGEVFCYNSVDELFEDTKNA